MNEIHSKSDSASPLKEFFDKTKSEDKIFQSCEVSALIKPLVTDEQGNYVYDLSGLKKISVLGSKAIAITENYFNLSNIKPFQWISVGSGGIICLSPEKILIVNSFDGSLIEGFATSVRSIPDECIVQRADYCEFAIKGALVSRVLSELMPVSDSAWSHSGLICGLLANANAILRKVNDRSDHVRCILQPADSHYVFSTILEISNEFYGQLGCMFSYLNYVDG